MSFITRRRSQYSMKKLYNWFHRYYGIVEFNLSSSVSAALELAVKDIKNIETKSAAEYACGSGLLSLKLAGKFSSVEGRDLSSGMIARAKKRMNKTGHTVNFYEGNILDITLPDNSYDWAFVSFALHLFSPDDVKKIMQGLLRISREGVIIIDHSRKWNAFAAFVEWLEGSYYDKFISTDFSEIAKLYGCTSFTESEIKHSSVMIFRK